jgi:hypothetical protein
MVILKVTSHRWLAMGHFQPGSAAVGRALPDLMKKQ